MLIKIDRKHLPAWHACSGRSETVEASQHRPQLGPRTTRGQGSMADPSRRSEDPTHRKAEEWRESEENGENSLEKAEKTRENLKEFLKA